MTATVSIDRVTATFRLPPHQAAVAARLDRILGGVVARGLERALDNGEVPRGEWFLERLDVPLPLELEASDGALEERWSAVLVRELRRALSERRDVVYYPCRRAALFDLVGDIASGRCERGWVWERLGLRARSDPSPAVAPADAILAALCRAPHEVVPAVIAASRRVGLVTLDRVLGADGWLAVAEIALGPIGGRPWGTSGPAPAPSPAAARHGAGAGESVALAQRVDAILSSSELVEQVEQSRLRPDLARGRAWATLAAAEVDPAVLGRAGAAGVVEAVAARLARLVLPPAAGGRGADAAAGCDVAAPPPGRDGGGDAAGCDVAAVLPGRKGGAGADPPGAPGGAGADPGGAPAGNANSGPDTARVAVESRAPGATVAARPGSDGDVRTSAGGRADTGGDAAGLEPAAGAATAWAGLLFLLNVADEIDLVDAVLDDPALASRPLRWVIHALAGRLVPLAEDDPAALALCGLGPHRPPPTRGARPASPAESERLDALAGAWARATSIRLAASADDPFEVVEGLAARTGRIVAEPGWIDVFLRLDDVEVDIRRAGLDLDPSWVPWLGCVVRFVYGE